MKSFAQWTPQKKKWQSDEQKEEKRKKGLHFTCLSNKTSTNSIYLADQSKEQILDIESSGFCNFWRLEHLNPLPIGKNGRKKLIFFCFMIVLINEWYGISKTTSAHPQKEKKEKPMYWLVC